MYQNIIHFMSHGLSFTDEHHLIVCSV